MKVFVKRYPSKGDFPSREGLYHTNIGRVSFNKTFDWIDHHNYTCSCPNYWLEEIELPSEDEIGVTSYSEAWKRDMGLSENNSYEDGYREGANYILNLLKQK